MLQMPTVKPLKRSIQIGETIYIYNVKPHAVIEYETPPCTHACEREERKKRKENSFKAFDM